MEAYILAVSSFEAARKVGHEAHQKDLNKEHLLSQNQLGFRKRHNKAPELLMIVHKWMQSIGKKKG